MLILKTKTAWAAWSVRNETDYLCVPVSGEIDKKGRLDVPRFINKAYPDVAVFWGEHVKAHGNTPCVYEPGRLISLPTRDAKKEPALLAMTVISAREINKMADQHNWTRVLVPVMSCATKAVLKRSLAAVLDDRFALVVHSDR